MAWGRIAPVVGVDVDEVVTTCVSPVLSELARRGTPFVGTLFVGLMLTADGPRVLEYNCRFGDPETQSVLPLVEGDLLTALAAAAGGSLGGVSLALGAGSAVTVLLTAGGYPAAADRGAPIEGIEQAEAAGALVFHSGTALRAGRLVTNGGRLLGVTATGPTLVAARRRAYEAADSIRIPGARRRADIALAAAEDGGQLLGFRGSLPGHPIPPPTANSIVLSGNVVTKVCRLRANCVTAREVRTSRAL